MLWSCVFQAYCTPCFLKAALLVVSILLAFMALRAAVVQPGSFEAASVAKHTDPPFCDGEIVRDCDDDCAASGGFEEFGGVHPSWCLGQGDSYCLQELVCLEV